MVKLTKGTLIGIILTVVVVAGSASAFLLVGPKKLYEIPEPSYKKGESYSHALSINMEAVGQKIEIQGELKQDYLDVRANESTTRTTLAMTMPAELEMQGEMKMVILSRQTRDGEIIATKIESVEPPEMEEMLGQMIGQVQIAQKTQKQKSTQEALNPASEYFKYPEGPVSIGEKWETDIDEEEETPTGTVTTTGKVVNCLESREKLTTPAGSFDCLKINTTIDMMIISPLGQNQTMVMHMPIDAVQWIAEDNGAMVKTEANCEMEMGLGTSMTLKMPFAMGMELTNYTPA